MPTATRGCAGCRQKARAVTGVCHICSMSRPIRYCSTCKHWFCADCRTRWFSRGLGFLKEKFLTGAKPGCCGPRAVV
jgi:hypothetical protein